MPHPTEYVAFFDLDHTILRGNSATYLVEMARQKGIMTPGRYRQAVFLSMIYKLRIGDPVRMIDRMLSWVNGLAIPTVEDLCREIFLQYLKGSIRPEILDTMEDHRKNRGSVVLLSSATSFICAPVSDYLGMDDVICTRLESKNGILTGHTLGKLVYGTEKRDRMLSFCREKKLDPAEAFYYGDSYTDLHVMKAVGRPVAVSPDRRLHKLATSSSWPVLDLDR